MTTILVERDASDICRGLFPGYVVVSGLLRLRGRGSRWTTNSTHLGGSSEWELSSRALSRGVYTYTGTYLVCMCAYACVSFKSVSKDTGTKNHECSIRTYGRFINVWQRKLVVYDVALAQRIINKKSGRFSKEPIQRNDVSCWDKRNLLPVYVCVQKWKKRNVLSNFNRQPFYWMMANMFAVRWCLFTIWNQPNH